jgi:hypothetical protein
MESFFSAALGANHEYRSYFSDNVKLVLFAHAGHNADLPCRDAGVSTPYAPVAHTGDQLKQVLIDFDKAEMNMRGGKAAAKAPMPPKTHLK